MKKLRLTKKYKFVFAANYIGYTYSLYDLLFKREKSLIIFINQQSIIVY